ncbi:MAG: carotenoid biosynthesis protein [Bacteroidota bacterium]|nr:carotenoid biosynthesis protein [Bacteroidota bacterium]MDP4196270.1 carotenoid biosynthesis protein [Bacteroidota bacterium]
MERQNILKEKTAFIILTLLYTVGVAGHSVKSFYHLMIQLTPYTLLLSGFIVLFVVFGGQFQTKFAFWSGAVFIAAFLTEAAGVATGIIFGRYYYGNTLGLSLLDVPVLIGFNWMFVVLGSASVSRRLFYRPFYSALSAALLAVIFDYAMEPVAQKLNYWHWTGGYAPLQNYISWGFFAFASSYILFKAEIKIPAGKITEKYFLIQFIFFCLLNVIPISV